MKKILLFVTVFFSLSKIIAQGFNGNIEFKYTTLKDTTVNIYVIKYKLIKLENYNKKGTIEGIFLFDLEKNEMKWLNPKRKLWGFQKSETPQIIHGQCLVTKGSATKTIAGAKCTEYTVKNSEENTVITYWITDSKYTFFAPLVKLWNHKGKPSIYFTQIKGLSEGSMPLLSEERQLSDNKMITRLEATKITNAAPADAAFAIPEGYTKLDK